MKISTPFYIEKRTGNNHISLDGIWDFNHIPTPAEEISQITYPHKATIPAATYWNINEAGVLPNPYEGTNSKLYRNLDTDVWYYRKKFTVERTINPETENAYLVFDGIGYYSKIWLNGEYLGNHEGMFGGPVCDVAEILKCGENELTVELKAYNYGLPEEKRFYGINGNHLIDSTAIIPWNVAKDASTSNGDFNTFGIWRSVRIEIMPKKHLARPYLYTKSVNGNNAVMGFELNIATEKIRELSVLMSAGEKYDYTFAYPNGLSGITSGEKVNIKIKIFDEAATVYENAEDFELYDYQKSGFTLEGQDLQIYRKNIELKNIQPWYPNGLGEAKLYNVAIELRFNGELLDSLDFKTGIRIIEQHESAGRKYRQRWDNYHFSVNGKKIFLKGMNWMPIDFLYKANRDDYRWTLEQVQNEGVQLLRVWSGGGMPEDDCFYEICDELGIMVWQDSFLANHNSPLWNGETLENQVCWYLYRIRNHPSLAVHCGGNEHRAYHTECNAAMYIVQRNVEDLDFSRKFYRVSPDRGSMHSYRDWEPVWYRKQFGDLPFMAECGIHCFPNAKSLRQQIKASEYSAPLNNIMSESFRSEFPELLNHFTEYQPDRIPRMLSRASHVANIKGINLENLCEATQLAAYEFYQIMCQSFREAYPHCVGLMPWVFKRSWTTVAIQMVDGLGETVAPYYAVKNSYAPILCFAALRELDYAPEETVNLPVKVINESCEEISATVTLDILAPDFKKVHSQSAKCVIGADTYITQAFCADFAIPKEWKDKDFFAVTKLTSNNKVISQCFYPLKCLSVMSDKKFRDEWREKPHENMFLENGPFIKEQIASAEKSQLCAEVIKTVKHENRVTVQVRIKCQNMPAYPVKLEIGQDKTVSYLSDNWFFMDAGEEKTVTVETRNLGNSEKLTLCITAWNSEKITLNI